MAVEICLPALLGLQSLFKPSPLAGHATSVSAVPHGSPAPASVTDPQTCLAGVVWLFQPETLQGQEMGPCTCQDHDCVCVWGVAAVGKGTS